MSGELSVESLVLDPAAYAVQRAATRARAIELRRRRRVPVGAAATLEFENAETLRYQVQEMLYVEGVTDPRAAAAEVAAYERLLPGDGWLAAPGSDVPPLGEGPATHTSAVHFLRFDLPPAMRDALAAGAPVRVVADHPEHTAVTTLTAECVGELRRDLGLPDTTGV